MWKALARACLSTHPVNSAIVDSPCRPQTMDFLHLNLISQKKIFFHSVLAFLGYLGKNLVFQLSPVFLS